jgi:hypothetical protein
MSILKQDIGWLILMTRLQLKNQWVLEYFSNEYDKYDLDVKNCL